jgi:hypothetical protein
MSRDAWCCRNPEGCFDSRVGSRVLHADRSSASFCGLRILNGSGFSQQVGRSLKLSRCLTLRWTTGEKKRRQPPTSGYLASVRTVRVGHEHWMNIRWVNEDPLLIFFSLGSAHSIFSRCGASRFSVKLEF